MTLRLNWFIPTKTSAPNKINFDRVSGSIWIRCLQLIPYFNQMGIDSVINDLESDTDISIFVRWQNSDAYENFQRNLLDKRNFQMADKIIELLDVPGHYFVLIGAAHLIGSNSIINILQERGITLQRVANDGSIQLNENLMSKEKYES